jgi:prepilin-type N-terminal cleavage/methylation domain-containing protein
MLRTGIKGVTLVEVMVATAILALGAVIVYQSFFLSLDLFNYYSDYLNVSSRVNEKIWQVQDELMRLGPAAVIEGEGEFTERSKVFSWTVSYDAIDEAQGMYEIDVSLSWRSGGRYSRILRSAYAKYKK